MGDTAIVTQKILPTFSMADLVVASERLHKKAAGVHTCTHTHTTVLWLCGFWTKIVKKDCQARKLIKEDAMDHKRWRKQIRDD